MRHRHILIIPVLAVIILNVLIFVPQPASAATYFKLIPTPTGSCPMNPGEADEAHPSGRIPYECTNGVCVNSGQIRGGADLPCNYSLCDFLQLFVNAMNIIVTISAGIALILLIWGAQGFLMSMGSEEKVTESKNLIKNAAIGLLIILVSWQLIAIIINFLVPQFSQLKADIGFAWDLSGDVHELCIYNEEEPSTGQ